MRRHRHQATAIRAVALLAVALVGLSTVTAVTAATATARPAASPAGRSARVAGATKAATYRGYEVDVPSTWPVIDLAANPRTCVRLDQPAIYLGHPGDVQDCPQHLVGRADVVVIEPADAQAAADHRVPVDAPAGTSPAPDAAQSANRLMRVHVTSAGVVVTEAWGADRSTVDAVVRSGRVASSSPSTSSPASTMPPSTVPSSASAASTTPPSTAPSSASAASTTPPSTAPSSTSAAPAARATAPHVAASAVAPVTHTQFASGEGFDSCDVPSSAATMSNLRAATGWVTVGMYLGGANSACPQLGFGASWVRSVAAQGWAIVPIWVGRQINSCGGQCITIDPTQAGAQGASEANAAVGAAQAVGIGPTSPIYYDLEAYPISSSNRLTAIAFIQGWTNQLHALGYTSGFYSSANSGIADMVAMVQGGYGGAPDELWIARYDCVATTSDAVVPASLWVNHRMKQYRSDTTPCSTPQLNVGFGYDSDHVGGNAAGAGAGGFPAFVNAIYQDLLGRQADPGGMSGWTSLLQNGMPLFSFVYAVATSPEHMSRVAGADYLYYLRRVPDAGGQQGWANILSFTHRNDLVEAAFLASDEYWQNFGHQDAATWLSQLYLDALGRPIDPGGQSGWLQAMQNGTSRLAVATAVVQSFEGAAYQVNRTYLEMLHRNADPTGKSGWASTLMQIGFNFPYLEAALGSSWESWSASQS